MTALTRIMRSQLQPFSGKPRSVSFVFAAIALVALAGLGYTILTFLIQLFSPAFELGTEHITIASAQRVADGLPPVTRPDRLPVTISSFTPFTFILIAPLLVLFKADQVMAIAITGRVLVLVMVILSVVCLRRILTRCFADQPPRLLSLSLGLYLMLLFLAFPGSIFVFRPDMLATFFELLAFSFFLGVLAPCQSDPQLSPRGAMLRGPLGLAALSAATAIAAKQNALGVAVGTVLTLAWQRRPRLVRRYLLWLVLGVAAWYGLFQLYLGDALRLSVLGSTASQLVVADLEGAIDFIRRLINELGFRYLPFYLLTIYGLVLMWSRNRDLAQATLFCTGSSFTLATVGQLKTGAWFNYHYTFFFLAAVPASLALAHLLRDAWRAGLLPLSMLLGFALSSLLYLALNLPFPLALVRSAYLDYASVANAIREDFPAGAVYANNSEAIYLHDRVLFAPWSEGILGYTPSLSDAIDHLRSGLRSHRYVAAVFQGGDCKGWRPSGLFESHLAHLTKFHRSVGKFCIYASPQP